MAIDTTTITTGAARSQMGGALLVPTTATGSLVSTTLGVTLMAGGSVVVAGIAYAVSSSYLQRRKNLRLVKNGQEVAVFKPPSNGKYLLSLGTGATLLVSVGSAMLPRTRTVMVVHIAAGFLCLALTFAHIYTYRKIVKAQTKKFWNFLSAPKTTTADPAPKKKAQAGAGPKGAMVVLHT